MKRLVLIGFTVSVLLFFMAGIASAITIGLDAKTTTIDNPVSILLDAGYYDVTPVSGEEDSWNAWGKTTMVDGEVTKGWINNYSLSSDEFAAYLVTDGIRYETPEIALANALSTSFTLTSESYVNFYIYDIKYTDNIGGMTLRVEKGVAPVPEPSTFLLLGGGLLGLGFCVRKRKKA